MEKKFSRFRFMSIEILNYHPHIRPMKGAESSNHVTIFSMLKMCIFFLGYPLFTSALLISVDYFT